MSSKKVTNDGASSSKGSRNIATTSETTNDPVNDPNAGDDKLFEPTLDMMVNDYDDESTLELEEQMASTEAQDPNAELNSLQRESDMPIEELLALYNCVTPPVHTLSSSSGSGASRRRSKTTRNIASEKYLMPPPDPPKSKTPDKDLGEKSGETKLAAENFENKDTADTVVVKDEAKSPKSANIQSTDDATEAKPLDDSPVDIKPIIEKENDANNENVAIKEVKEEQMDERETSKPASTESNEGQNNKATESNTTADDDSPGKSNADEEMEIEEDEEEDDEEEEEEESELKKLYPETYKTNEPRLLRANSQPNSDDEEEEEDIDYCPEEDEFKKKIMVGSEYQAQIPEGLCRYDDALPYENEDKLVWDPSQLQECDIEVYLQKANIPVIVGSPTNSPSSPSSQNSINQKCPLLPCGNHLRDDEQSLYLLLQCGHNTEEALRRRRLNATLPPVVAVAVAATASNQSPGNDTRMSLWSEEECRNFESGLRVYGKDFHAIQQSKVRTRSVSELVQFYYLWKKTERHDIFANKARLEKKKYNLHPGLTDYMDRFLEEQENNGGISINASNHSITQTLAGAQHGNNNGMEHGSRDRSLSPINCLLYADCKRQRRSHETSTE